MLKYWLWLSSLSGISGLAKLMLIENLGNPENIYFAEPRTLCDAAELTETELRALSNKSFDRAEGILEDCDRENVQILTFQDTLYPERLRNIYDPPFVLYYKGTFPFIDEEPCLSIVGTRHSSAYGSKIAIEISYELSKNGMFIISGMAEGIDGAAHLGALRAGKPTLAVLGSGVDKIFPAMHRDMYYDIISNGAVISEHPPLTPVTAANFPRRNRIITGLSLGLLVVEAPKQSGALISARLASEQGRDIFAIPGNITSRESLGSNKLIQDGATLVISALDILKEYAAKFPHKIITSNIPNIPNMPKQPKREETPTKPTKKYKKELIEPPAPPQVAQVVDLTEMLKDYEAEQQRILVQIAVTPMNVDQISDRTGLSAEFVLSELTILQIDGIIEELPGNVFKFVMPRIQ